MQKISVGSAAPVLFLPEADSKVSGVTYGEVGADETYLLANINEAITTATLTNVKDYDETVKENTEEAEDAIAGYVKLLLGSNGGTDLAELFAKDLLAEDSKVTGTYNPSEHGSAVITITAGSEPELIASDAASTPGPVTKSIYVPANSTLVITLYGDEDVDANTGSFSVESFGIESGSILVAGADYKAPNAAFERIILSGVTGAATGTVTSNQSTSVAKVTDFEVTVDSAFAEGTGTASASVKEIKPEYNSAAQTVTVKLADYDFS